MENFTLAHFLIEAVVGALGMLLGGFIVYHKIEWMMLALQKEIARVDKEQKEEMEMAWEKIDTLQTKELCTVEKRSCNYQFSHIKESHDEIKDLFRELRGDLKSELKLLRECISSATKNQC